LSDLTDHCERLRIQGNSQAGADIVDIASLRSRRLRHPRIAAGAMGKRSISRPVPASTVSNSRWRRETA